MRLYTIHRGDPLRARVSPSDEPERRGRLWLTTNKSSRERKSIGIEAAQVDPISSDSTGVDALGQESREQVDISPFGGQGVRWKVYTLRRLFRCRHRGQWLESVHKRPSERLF